MSRDLKHIHPRAMAALEKAQRSANMKAVIVQTLGNAKDSAGFHAADGTYKAADGSAVKYCAAVDFSVRQKGTKLSDGSKVPMDEAHIQWFLSHLANNGWVGWYRRPSQGFHDPHIHCVYAGVPMKAQLQAQVRDFVNDRTGLVGHATETFFTAPPIVDAAIRALFDKYN